jgi:hypothetical protein
MPSQQVLSPVLLAVAAGQRGVFTSTQAYEAGHTEKEIQRLRKAKVLASVRRGVYALREAYDGADAVEQHRMRVAALALCLTAQATLSHETAAAEHGLELLDPDLSVLHVTRSDGSATRIEAGVKHHAAELPEHHVVRADWPFDMTALARTAVDVARGADRFECAVAAFDSALRMGVPREELDEAFQLSRSWPGARLASGALAMADGRADNPGESWSRVILTRLGLPPLDLQVAVHDEDGLIGYADFGWDGVLGELDGKGKYGIGVDTDPEEAGRILWREKKREDRIRRRGWEIARWTYAEHYRTAVIAARVRQAQARAAGRRGRAG